MTQELYLGDPRDEGAVKSSPFPARVKPQAGAVDPDAFAVLLHDFDIIKEAGGGAAAGQDKAFLLVGDRLKRFFFQETKELLAFFSKDLRYRAILLLDDHAVQIMEGHAQLCRQALPPVRFA